MGQLFTCVFVLAVSLTLHAEIEFGSVISNGVRQQNQAARDIHNSVQIASNTDTDTNKTTTIPSSTPSETAPDQVVHHSDEEGMGQDEKDFTVQLRQTGHGPAARYFEVAYRESQILKAKERAERRLALKAKKEKQRQARLARNQQKLKKSSRSVASAKTSRKLKSKSRKTTRAEQASRI